MDPAAKVLIGTPVTLPQAWHPYREPGRLKGVLGPRFWSPQAEGLMFGELRRLRGNSIVAS